MTKVVCGRKKLESSVYVKLWVLSTVKLSLINQSSIILTVQVQKSLGTDIQSHFPDIIIG